MAYLEVKNLHKKLGDLKVLKGVNFELDKGEVLCVLGSSGNGKTTLLKTLSGLNIPDCGEIIVDGKKLFPYTTKKTGQENPFGLVFQNFNLFPQYTALENVTLAMNLKAQKEIKALQIGLGGKKKKYSKVFSRNKDTALSLLKRVGLEDKINFYPWELSGGQQQRVAIARALSLSPEILCFDEPTSALDPELTDEVLKVIKSLKDNNRTMIIVTHEMYFAKNVSDKVLFMNDGIVEEFGTSEQIFSTPKSKKLQTFISNSLEKDYLK